MANPKDKRQLSAADGAGSVPDDVKAFVLGCGWGWSRWGSSPWSLEVAGMFILGYQIDVLCKSGIKQCFLCEDANVDPHSSNSCASVLTNLGLKVEDDEASYLDMQIKILRGHSWRSEGNSLRAINEGQFDNPTSDFLLVLPGALPALNLARMVKQHQQRKLKDRRLALTMLFRRGDPSDTGLYIVYDRNTGRLHRMNQLEHGKGLKIGIADLFGEKLDRGEMHVLSRVGFTGIGICSPEAASYFTDNFDRDKLFDFTSAMLEQPEEELLFEHIIGVEILDSTRQEYAMRINSFAAYAQATQDVLRRWSFPLVPDHFPFTKSVATVSRGNTYRAETADVSRSCQLGRNSIICDNSKLEEKVEVSQSCILRDVTIGSDSKIEGSIIMSGSRIGKHAVIVRSVVGEGVEISDGSKIGPGVVLGAGTVVGTKSSIPPGSWYARGKASDDAEADMTDTDDDSDEHSDEHSEEEGGNIGNLEDEAHSDQLGLGGRGARIERRKRDPFSDPVENDLSWMEESQDEESEEEFIVVEVSEKEKYEEEVRETIARAFAMSHGVLDTSHEISSLKMVSNRSLEESIFAVIKGLLSQSVNLASESSTGYDNLNPSAFLQAVVKIFSDWKQLAVLFNGAGIVENQLTIISAVQEFFETNSKLQQTFPGVLKVCYDNDVVDEDAILVWRDRTKEKDASSSYLEIAQPFLSWLEEAESEDESEEDESE